MQVSLESCDILGKVGEIRNKYGKCSHSHKNLKKFSKDILHHHSGNNE